MKNTTTSMFKPLRLFTLLTLAPIINVVVSGDKVYVDKEKKCVTILFSGNITSRRAAHIMKFLEILSPWMNCINIVATRIEKEAVIDFSSYRRERFSGGPQVRFIILEPQFNSIEKKKSLLKDIVISLAQLPRIREYLKCDGILITGTINIANVMLSRLSSSKSRLLVFAGGFSYMGIEANSLKNAAKRCLIYLIEFVHTLLADYLLIEAPTMRRHVPFSKVTNALLKNKLIDFANLCVEDYFFQDCEKFESRIYDIGYVGALEERRYIKELLLTMKYLPRFLNKKVRVLIIGDGPLRHVVESFAKKYRDPESAIFVDYIPSVPRYRLQNYYRKIKILVLPTRSDGLPNTIIEAMASCCTVISTDIGGIPSVIDNNVTGFIIQNGNIVLELLKLIKQLFSNDYKIAKIGTNARQRVLKSFSKVPVQIKWKHILDLARRA